MRHTKVFSNFIRVETDQNLKVEWSLYPGCRGARDSCGGVAGAGPALEPDEPAELEFIKAVNEKNEQVELTDSEIESAMESAWEQLAEAEEPPEPDYDFSYDEKGYVDKD